MGRALLAAIRTPETQVAPSTAGPGLQHPRRAQLFRFFCLHPVGVVADAARATKVSASAFRWHGAKLVDTAWLTAHGTSYYPRVLVDATDLPLFEAVATGAARRTFAEVFEVPGQSVSALARAVGLSRQATARFVADFVSVGLVSTVSDGPFVRVYGTSLLAERREANRARVRAFCAETLRRLRAGRLAPEVLRQTSSELWIRYGFPRGRAVLNVPLDPFTGALLE